MDVYKPKGVVSGYCYSREAICPFMQKIAAKSKASKASKCTTQRIAFCFWLVDPYRMGRQLYCARSMDNCEARRKYHIANPWTEHQEAGECKETHNIGQFETDWTPGVL